MFPESSYFGSDQQPPFQASPIVSYSQFEALLGDKFSPNTGNLPENVSSKNLETEPLKKDKGKKQQKQKRKYCRKDHELLWLTLMSVVNEKQLFFTSWKYKMKTDVYELMNRKLGGNMRQKIKGWASDQRKKYKKNIGPDLFEGIENTVGDLIESGKVNDPKQIAQFEKFKEFNRSRNQLAQLFDTEKMECIKSQKHLRKFSKMFLGKKQEKKPQQLIKMEQQDNKTEKIEKNKNLQKDHNFDGCQ